MSVDAYKLLLGYGARTNRFSVDITIPDKIRTAFPAGGIGGAGFGGATSIIADTLNIMCHEITFPQPRKIEVFNIDYDGEIVNLAKGRESAYEQITLKYREKEDMEHRKFFLYWQEFIQKTITNESKSALMSYKNGSIDINLENRENKAVIYARCYQIFPVSITYDATLSYTDSKIMETSVVFSVDRIDYLGKKGSILGIGGKFVNISTSSDVTNEPTIDKK